MSEASLMLTMSRPTQCFVTHAPDPGPPTTPPPGLLELKDTKGLEVGIGLCFRRLYNVSASCNKI